MTVAMCGFTDVRKNATGYYCTKCGKVMSDAWIVDVKHKLPAKYWRQLQSQIEAGMNNFITPKQED